MKAISTMCMSPFIVIGYIVGFIYLGLAIGFTACKDFERNLYTKE